MRQSDRLIVAVGPLGDLTPASKIKQEEEKGPAVQLETPGIGPVEITAAKIMMEDGEMPATQLTIHTSFEILQQKDLGNTVEATAWLRPCPLNVL